MLQHANYLLGAAYDVALDTDGVTPKYDPLTHRPIWNTTPGNVKSLAALNTLRRYVGVLNVMRQFLVDAG
jgi:hypothetical protein